MYKIYSTTETAQKTNIPERTVRRYITNGTNGFPTVAVVTNGRKVYGATEATIRAFNNSMTRKIK